MGYFRVIVITLFLGGVVSSCGQPQDSSGLAPAVLTLAGEVMELDAQTAALSIFRPPPAPLSTEDKFAQQADRLEKLKARMKNLGWGRVYKWNEINLNRSASRRDDSPSHTGFRWNDGDFKTKEWYPQGITTQYSSRANKMGKKFLAVSWYQKSSYWKNVQKGARISFVNVTNMGKVKYRHVLLVEPYWRNGKIDFKPINFHAGGIAWYHDKIYAAHTGTGFRVFSPNIIFRAAADTGKTRMGIINGKPYARNYRYIMPMWRVYSLNEGRKGDDKIRFSSVAVDHTPAGTGNYKGAPSLTSGEYCGKSGSYKCGANYRKGRTYTWKLDPKTGWLKYLSPSYMIKTGRYKIQGAVIYKHWLYLSQSSPSNAPWYAEDAAAIYRVCYTDYCPGRGGLVRYWDNGNEDLAYVPSSQNIWVLNEHPKHRNVYATRTYNLFE